MKQTKPKGAVMLFLTACIWGFAFAFQRQGVMHMGPVTFNALRYFIGAAVLTPLFFILRKKEKKLFQKSDIKRNIKGGIACGVCLFLASSLQQMGILYTSAGKAGFLTTLYIILIPICGIFMKKKIPGIVWPACFLSAVGMYLLCVSENMGINKGDVYALLGAVVFTAHILAVDYFASKTDCILLSLIQFVTAACLGMVYAFLFETPDFSGILDGIVPLLYVGIMSSGVAYTLQIVGQKYTDPTIAALIMSLESAVSVLGGWILLDEKLSGKEMLGCFLMFVSVTGVQIFQSRLEKKPVPDEKEIKI